MKKIVFTGGGTLGHVKPCFSIIENLSKDDEVFFIGSNGMEKEYVKSKGIKFYEIETVKLVRGKFWTNLLIPFKLFKSVRQAKKILKDIKPNLIFSKGGYVALPVAIAGKKLHIPVIAHESDYSFGVANKIILRYSDVMLVNFPKLTEKSKKVELIGPIISNDFKEVKKCKLKLDLDENKKTILFMGGSLGAKSLNEVVFEAVEKLSDYNIVHIVGKGKGKKIKAQNYNQFEIVEEIASLINLADIVVSRAGANSIFETLYLKKPMILIPLNNTNSRGDQMENARYFFEKGAVRILYEEKLSPNNLAVVIRDTFSKKKEICENIEKLHLTSGVDYIIDKINEY